MHTLREQDRDAPMVNLVSFHNVPMPRMIAFTIDHIEKHGARVDIFSADRTVAAIAAHNEQFNTHLHAQLYLFQNQGKPGFNPANPPNRTSHCYFADAVIALLLTHNGHPVRVGGEIPRWALGVDLSDHGKAEDISRFLTVARRLGYDFRQPYIDQSRERHHVILVNSPIPKLEAWNVISENRSPS